jgi:hypothetical protein
MAITHMINTLGEEDT